MVSTQEFSSPDGQTRRVTLIGSTGSVGTQALEVIDAAPDRFNVVALSGGYNLPLLAAQAVKHRVAVVGSAVESKDELAAAIKYACNEASVTDYSPELFVGASAASELAAFDSSDVVLNGITGAIGLEPTIAALKAGHLLALANKESLIIGGHLVKQLAGPGQLAPVDSEHSALAQALRSGAPNEVERLIVTASGGPFFGYTYEQLRNVTPEQAMSHPTYAMGRVITTNSATMVNKALEVIEAHLLFDVPLERIQPVVHRQSIVHSMVEFIDGSVIAQASPPDMRLPIALGLNWPHRVAGAVKACDFSKSMQWTFEPLDEEVFTAVKIAKQAAAASGTHMAVYNAANEVAVDAFHEGKIKFTDIVETIERVLEAYTPVNAELCVEVVLETDKWARAHAAKILDVAL